MINNAKLFLKSATEKILYMPTEGTKNAAVRLSV